MLPLVFLIRATRPMEPTAPTTRYVFCNNVPSVVYAARVLAQSPVLIIDCEGRNIGGLDGALSLVCIGTERAEHVFVFDVLALRVYGPHVQPLLSVLANPGAKKVLWDCRNDYLEILSEYRVALQSVVDLQLAEIQARITVKREKDFTRMARLAAGGKRLPLRLIKQNPELFFGVHSLKGMDACIREAKLPTAGKDRKLPCGVRRRTPRSLHFSPGRCHAQRQWLDCMAAETSPTTVACVRCARHRAHCDALRPL